MSKLKLTSKEFNLISFPYCLEGGESNQTEFLRFAWQNKDATYKVRNIYSVILQFGSK